MAAGPDAEMVVSDVLRRTAVLPQRRGLHWPAIALHRPMILAATGLLLVALLASFAAGQLPPRPLPESPSPSPDAVDAARSAIVIQQWNGRHGEGDAVTQTVHGPDAKSSAPLESVLPSNAVSLSWSPNGRYLVYFTRNAVLDTDVHGPPNHVMLRPTGIFVAGPDGSSPRSVQVSAPLDSYPTNGLESGAVWAPTSDHFAIAWSASECSGQDCMPPAGIDVFDPQGRLVVSIDTQGNFGWDGVWSPDGAAIGWSTGTCLNGECRSDSFNWRAVVSDASDSITTLRLGQNRWVAWSADNRLQVVHSSDDGEILEVYTMAPDGTDVREVAWPNGSLWSWSPQGRFLGFDYEASELIVRDADTETESRIAVADDLYAAVWSPESDRLVLVGEGAPLEVEDDGDAGPGRRRRLCLAAVVETIRNKRSKLERTGFRSTG
jgi:Tol biopolymer transport system component